MKFKQNITKGLNRSSLCIGCKKLMTVFGFVNTLGSEVQITLNGS